MLHILKIAVHLLCWLEGALTSKESPIPAIQMPASESSVDRFEGKFTLPALSWCWVGLRLKPVVYLIPGQNQVEFRLINMLFRALCGYF